MPTGAETALIIKVCKYLRAKMKFYPVIYNKHTVMTYRCILASKSNRVKRTVCRGNYNNSRKKIETRFTVGNKCLLIVKYILTFSQFERFGLESVAASKVPQKVTF